MKRFIISLSILCFGVHTAIADETPLEAHFTAQEASVPYYKMGWDKVMNCMYGHTFDLTCDYKRRPSWIRLTDIDNPTNVITVYANPSYFMEDQSYYQDKN